MPIYEYQCDACGHVLDALQKLGDAPLKKCPDCGKPKLKRLLSAPMFLLKGTGWYETDFKGDKERRKNLADRPEPDKTESVAKAEAKSDGKDGKAGTTADAKSDAKSDERKADKKETAAVAESKPASASGGNRASATARRPLSSRTARKSRSKPKGRRRH